MTNLMKNVSSLRDALTGASWIERLQDQFELPYMRSLCDYLQSERELGKTIYPENSLVFSALNASQVSTSRPQSRDPGSVGRDYPWTPDQVRGVGVWEWSGAWW